MRSLPTNVYCFVCKKSMRSYDVESGICNCGAVFAPTSIESMLAEAGLLREQGSTNNNQKEPLIIE
jgi:hypothetical protein